MTFLMDFGIKSALALGLAFLVAIALWRGPASVRYAMWTCALAAVLLLPAASFIGPQWNIDRSAWRRATATVTTVAPSQESPSDSVIVIGGTPRPWSQNLPAMVWIVGVVAMLLRLAAGHWRVRSLFGTAEEIRDRSWIEFAQETAASIGFGRRVVLRRSTATDVPLTYGLIRATVLLPGESDQWTEERRRIVLAHEMVHARRLDSVWGLLAQCALAVNWFNPLAWLAVKQFRREQERSCDDAVVTAGTESTVYAGHLVELARSITIPEPALGMAEAFDLEGRVQALLEPGRRREAVSRSLCAAIFAAALALLMPLAAIHAQPTAALPHAIHEIGSPMSQEATAPPAEIENEAISLTADTAIPEQAAAVAPQTTTSRTAMTGSVYDPSGAIIVGAIVSLKSTGGANEEIALTDSTGHYNVSGIPAGEYLLKVSKPGFARYQRTMPLEAGVPASVNVNLSIGEVEETIAITGKRPESTVARSSTPQRIRVGGMVQSSNLIRRVNPSYPDDARAEGVEGTVLLRAVISKSGGLLSINPVTSSVDQRLVRAAVAAVSVWQYQPTLLNGEPVEVLTTIAVTFRLD